MSASLAQLQSSLLTAIACEKTTDAINSIANTLDFMPAIGQFSFKNKALAERGLLAYRANASALAARSLAATYPVITQLLGQETAEYLARDLWRAHPPERGDVAQWGATLPEFFTSQAALQELIQEHPFLPDVARLEWALHCAATAADTSLDASSLQLLCTHDPQQLQLQLSAGCALIASAHPIVAIAQLHDARYADEHTQAVQAIETGTAQTALIWRRGLRAVFRAAHPAEYALLHCTLQGKSFAQCVDAALARDAQFDLGAWLAASVQSGLMHAITHVPQTEC
jgi:Putative DNA-binding domain